jgi:uncharacterized protein YbjT (DUF2867 family)
MEGKSPVITGATGQVGRATIDALVRRGIRPTALVRGSINALRREANAGEQVLKAWVGAQVIKARINFDR